MILCSYRVRVVRIREITNGVARDSMMLEQIIITITCDGYTVICEYLLLLGGESCCTNR